MTELQINRLNQTAVELPHPFRILVVYGCIVLEKENYIISSS